MVLFPKTVTIYQFITVSRSSHLLCVVRGNIIEYRSEVVESKFEYSASPADFDICHIIWFYCHTIVPSVVFLVHL